MWHNKNRSSTLKIQKVRTTWYIDIWHVLACCLHACNVNRSSTLAPSSRVARDNMFCFTSIVPHIHAYNVPLESCWSVMVWPVHCAARILLLPAGHQVIASLQVSMCISATRSPNSMPCVHGFIIYSRRARNRPGGDDDDELHQPVIQGPRRPPPASALEVQHLWLLN